MLPGLMRRQAAPAVGRLERALVVEVDVGDDRDPRRADDLAERGGAVLVGTRDADDVGARRPRSGGSGRSSPLRRTCGVGHRLHGDRRVAADRHVADHDLAALAPQ
jgi:hypothetical protein